MSTIVVYCVFSLQEMAYAEVRLLSSDLFWLSCLHILVWCIVCVQSIHFIMHNGSDYWLELLAYQFFFLLIPKPYLQFVQFWRQCPSQSSHNYKHYLVTDFSHAFLVQIFSLWAVSDKKYGGLSFSSQDVGIVLAISGEHQEDGLPVLLLKRFCYVLTRT